MGRLAGGVAHDFNNLLTVIAGFNALLLEELTDTTSAGYAIEVQRAAERGATLTQQLLAFSRQQIVQPRVTDLNTVVSNAAKLLQRLIGEDIRLVTTLAPDLGKIRVDPGHIDQVIMNLAVNARDAMDRGGVLRMETANVELDAEYAGRHLGPQPGAYVMLAVNDTGAGMTLEVKQRLFEPFFTTKGLGKGTGLGLSIVYGIVKQNQGEVVVYSEVGRGTTFKIYFPQVEGIDDDPSQDRDVRQAAGTATILLCEDEEVVRKLVSTMLSRSGYRVLAAAGPDEAIRIAETHPAAIDLMLTDVVMPEMNGPELYLLLREQRPELKVLYMSGYTDNAVVEQAALTGGGNFLQKPFTRDGLIAKLQSALTSQQ